MYENGYRYESHKNGLSILSGNRTALPIGINATYHKDRYQSSASLITDSKSINQHNGITQRVIYCDKKIFKMKLSVK